MTSKDTLGVILSLIGIANDYPDTTDAIEEMVMLRAGAKIPVVRAHHARTGLSLKESRALVENAGLRLGLLAPDDSGNLVRPSEAKRGGVAGSAAGYVIKMRYVVECNGEILTGPDGHPFLFGDQKGALLAFAIFDPEIDEIDNADAEQPTEEGDPDAPIES